MLGQLPPAVPVTIPLRPELDEKTAALARKQTSLFKRAYTAWLSFYGSNPKDMGVPKAKLEDESPRPRIPRNDRPWLERVSDRHKIKASSLTSTLAVFIHIRLSVMGSGVSNYSTSIL